MEYEKVKEIAEKWGVSERTVRDYCAKNRVEGAVLIGKTWKIPTNAEKPGRLGEKKTRTNLLDVLTLEKKTNQKGGIYHKMQVEFTYNSNHMEGNQLSHDQTRYIYETNALEAGKGSLNVDDVVETANHFRCIDLVIENANYSLSENFIKKLHFTLKNGTSDSREERFAVGKYKKFPNQIGGKETTAPKEVKGKIQKILADYHKFEDKDLVDLLEFHYRFERIHPFQDGNGRVGRLILLKECLKNNIVPFIINEELKLFYYRGLDQWEKERGYLIDACRNGQDTFQGYLDYFLISYKK